MFVSKPSARAMAPSTLLDGCRRDMPETLRVSILGHCSYDEICQAKSSIEAWNKVRTRACLCGAGRSSGAQVRLLSLASRHTSRCISSRASSLTVREFAERDCRVKSWLLSGLVPLISYRPALSPLYAFGQHSARGCCGVDWTSGRAGPTQRRNADRDGLCEAAWLVSYLAVTIGTRRYYRSIPQTDVHTSVCDFARGAETKKGGRSSRVDSRLNDQR
jgi:hypothetical protein